MWAHKLQTVQAVKGLNYSTNGVTKMFFDRKCLEKCQNLILLGEDHNYVQNTTNKNKVYLIFEYN